MKMMRMLRCLGLLAGLVFLITGISVSAEIVVTPSGVPETAFISINGRLEPGDERKFAQTALQYDRALVIFDSPGGDLLAGIGIGKAIRLKEYTTVVGENILCASACGLAWLGGVSRLAHPRAMIGFHAAYVSGVDGDRETGAGNALVGAYLSQLGLPDTTIIRLTERPPNDMAWLPLQTTRSWGIDYELIANTAAGPNRGRLGSTEEQTVSEPPQFKTLDGYDIFGFDLTITPLRGHGIEYCAAACIRDANCQAFTFNKPNSACFLKGGGNRVVRNPNAIAGYKLKIEAQLRLSSITVLEKTDIPGHDYKRVKTEAFESCMSECEQDSQCAAFTFVKRHSTCWLKSRVSSATSNKTAISGFKGK